ncbi:MAG: helix-hairpin-helix domain-containing protein [Deltaproteobacteria bacterium]|jgi:uncharacterized protein|nr:helix-hairpin-helix domain-containing protein [Deltaproteobacteria bacterium]
MTDVIRAYIKSVSYRLRIRHRQLQATIGLLDEGLPVPFIARYRKEETEGLDEEKIRQISHANREFENLNRRLDGMLKSLEERGLLTPELETRLTEAEDMAQLEDSYLPYRSRTLCLAKLARKQGLEPLATRLMEQNTGDDPEVMALEAIDGGAKADTIEEALNGARHIISEVIFHDEDALLNVRDLYQEANFYATSADKRDKGENGQETLFSEKVSKVSCHRYYWLKNGQSRGEVEIEIQPNHMVGLEIMGELFLRKRSPSTLHVEMAMNDAYHYLLCPHILYETEKELLRRCEEEACRLLSRSLQEIVLAKPMRDKRLLALNPNIALGTRYVAMEPDGRIIEHGNIHTHGDPGKAKAARETIRRLIETHGLKVIAIGTTPTHKDIFNFVKNTCDIPKDIPIALVHASGLINYANSGVAATELPDFDACSKGCVSIGRRLLDPLSELSKIEPTLIVMSNYQLEMDQFVLRDALREAMEAAVNYDGLDVNVAPVSSLRYVCGLDPTLAANIVRHREHFGPFRNRMELLEVPGIDSRIFRLCSGFLLIKKGDNPLDGTMIHPEAYKVVEKMAWHFNKPVAKLFKDGKLRKKIVPERYFTDTINLPTIMDIIDELTMAPQQQPKKPVPKPLQASKDYTTMAELKPGMCLTGVVRGITTYGAFVYIGLNRNGLVHLSEICEQYIEHPSQVLSINQTVTAWVRKVDADAGRLELTMKRPENEIASFGDLERFVDAETGDVLPSTPASRGKNFMKLGNALSSKDLKTLMAWSNAGDGKTEIPPEGQEPQEETPPGAGETVSAEEADQFSPESPPPVPDPGQSPESGQGPAPMTLNVDFRETASPDSDEAADEQSQEPTTEAA